MSDAETAGWLIKHNFRNAAAQFLMKNLTGLALASFTSNQIMKELGSKEKPVTQEEADKIRCLVDEERFDGNTKNCDEGLYSTIISEIGELLDDLGVSQVKQTLMGYARDAQASYYQLIEKISEEVGLEFDFLTPYVTGGNNSAVELPRLLSLARQVSTANVMTMVSCATLLAQRAMEKKKWGHCSNVLGLMKGNSKWSAHVFGMARAPVPQGHKVQGDSSHFDRLRKAFNDFVKSTGQE